MKSHIIKKIRFLPTAFLAAVFYLGLICSTQAGEHQQHSQHNTTMKTGQSEHVYKRHKKGHKYKKHQLGDYWKDTLTKAQQLALDKAHLAYVRQKAPLKAEIKMQKVQFMALATSDQESTQELANTIKVLTLLKSKMLQAKAQYIAAQRKILTAEQRVSFDLEKMHKAMHKRKYKKGKKGGMKH